MTTLGSRAARGAAVTMVGQAARIAIQILSVVLLSRLLSPHDYGLLAYVIVIVGFGEIFRDFGLSSAAVQSPTLSVGEKTNLFWTNATLGLVLGTLLFAAAGPLASGLDIPRLQPIAQVMSLIFVFNGLMTQFRANLLRALRFGTVAGIEVVASATALVAALLFALNGWGVWALVGQQLIQAGLVLILLMATGRWLPRFPQRKVSIRRFLGFGGNVVLAQIVNYGADNVDNVLIGLRHGTNALGNYNRAYQLIMRPFAQIQTPLTTVALPVMSRVQDDDEQFGRFAIRGQIAMGYSLAVGLGIVCGLADPLVQLMLGPQWSEAVPLVRLLAILGIGRTLAFVGFWVYLARGLTRNLFRYSLVTGAIRVICVLVGSQWGVVGVAAGMAVAQMTEWPMSIYWLSRLTTLPARSLYAGAGRVLTVTTVTGAGAWFASSLTTGAGVSMLGAGLTGAVLTFCVLLIAPMFRRDALSLVKVLRLVLARQV